MDKNKFTTLKQIIRKLSDDSPDEKIMVYNFPWAVNRYAFDFVTKELNHAFPTQDRLDEISDMEGFPEKAISASRAADVDDSYLELTLEVVKELFQEEGNAILSNGILIEHIYSGREEGGGDYDSWRYVLKTTHPDYDAPRCYSVSGYYSSQNGVDLETYELANCSLVEEVEIKVIEWREKPEEDFDTPRDETSRLYK